MGFSGMDLLVHVTVFGLWGFAVGWELPNRQVWALVVLGVGLAVCTEVLQIAVPGRAFSWWDLLADGTGALIGVAAARLARQWGTSRSAAGG